MPSSTKQERSRLSAKECRARKKLRYQYLEEVVASTENAVLQLRAELLKVGLSVLCTWWKQLYKGMIFVGTSFKDKITMHS